MEMGSYYRSARENADLVKALPLAKFVERRLAHQLDPLDEEPSWS